MDQWSELSHQWSKETINEMSTQPEQGLGSLPHLETVLLYEFSVSDELKILIETLVHFMKRKLMPWTVNYVNWETTTEFILAWSWYLWLTLLIALITQTDSSSTFFFLQPFLFLFFFPFSQLQLTSTYTPSNCSSQHYHKCKLINNRTAGFGQPLKDVQQCSRLSLIKEGCIAIVGRDRGLLLDMTREILYELAPKSSGNDCFSCQR